MHPTTNIGEFVNTWEEAILLTYRASTHNFYRDFLNKHFRTYLATWQLYDIHVPEI